MAAVEQELAQNEANRAVVVRAPQDGTVSAIAADVGQAVAGGDVLAAVLA